MISKRFSIRVIGIAGLLGMAFLFYAAYKPLISISAQRSLHHDSINSKNWINIHFVTSSGQDKAQATQIIVYSHTTGTDRRQLLNVQDVKEGSSRSEKYIRLGVGTAPLVDVVLRFSDGKELIWPHIVANSTLLFNYSRKNRLHKELPDQLGLQWTPYLEWCIINPSFSGNPFDINASATFTHKTSGEVRTTGLFYMGSDQWHFRFTGTQPGQWDFVTDSEDPQLDGLYGRVVIEMNSSAEGFVTNVANKWGRTGNNKVFVPQYVMMGGPQIYYNKPKEIKRQIAIFLDEHGFNGFHMPVYCRWFDLDSQRCSEIKAMDPNPDLRTFEVLEQIISEVHSAGGVVHVWMWGDDSRKENPKKWGLNGNVDKRLQRYIAARLGPLPGWTMGYGYDLYEWVNQDQLTEWHAFMQKHMGWRHLLGARSSKNRLDQLSGALDYSSYEQHRPDYQMYVRTIERRPNKPSFSEDRFRLRNQGRKKDYTMERTRRGLWHSTMAGGVANIWGNLLETPHKNSSLFASAPYPNPEMIKTYARFFENRFWADMSRCNELSNGKGLKRTNNEYYIFYAEDVHAIKMDLRSMKTKANAIAVDTRRPYEELEIGLLSPGKHIWKAPFSSDWAIGVGHIIE